MKTWKMLLYLQDRASGGALSTQQEFSAHPTCPALARRSRFPPLGNMATGKALAS